MVIELGSVTAKTQGGTTALEGPSGSCFLGDGICS